MTILLVDAGNTRVKLGWLDRRSGRREERALVLAHEHIGELAAQLERLDLAPQAAIGVNVAGTAAGQALNRILEQRYAISVQWIASHPHAAGVLNGYDIPAQLGPDRWMSMLGVAHRAQRAPLLLASFGTATTIDTLAPEPADTAVAMDSLPREHAERGMAGHGAPGPRGRPPCRFHGGLIFPGPALMRSSLANGTANLPEAQAPIAAFPTYTHQAISSGIAAAQAGALLRQWREGLQRFGQPPQVFSTGGAWPLVEEEARRVLARAQQDLGLPIQDIEWLPAPVLDGLAALASGGDFCS